MKLLNLSILVFSLLAGARVQATGHPLPVNDTSGKSKLFDSDEVLPIKLSGNLRDLMNDRGERVQNHAITVTYKTDDGAEMAIPAQARTRGHFRKTSGTCVYPPLLLQFSNSEAVDGSVFENHRKLKLVMPCQGDAYVVREWMVYRLYNLVTTKSLKARLVAVQLDDVKRKNKEPFYGILLEEDDQMAERNKSVVVNTKMLRPENTEKSSFLTMAVFQFLIGNTDWSVQYLQNIKLIASNQGSQPATVAYDFDHAGIVNAPYAQPAEALSMGSVQERRYRGYCITDMEQYAEVVLLYNSLKEDIYKLYSSCPLLDAKYVKSTLKYFDEFYATINNPKAMQKQFGYPCDKNGTGNVVIQGLKKN